MTDLSLAQNTDVLERIATALERIAPPADPTPNYDAAEGFIWQPRPPTFQPVGHINRIPLGLLKGVDRTAEQLLDNTRRFAEGFPANNALLWGARGMGKSSLVKAAHAEVRQSLGFDLSGQPDLKLVEINREDIDTLPACLTLMRTSPHRFIVFCDDLSFDQDDTSYKSLKAVLDGGIEGRPVNVIFYATSNRRHLMPRQMME
ncbi:MAG: ATP-binding protein, partial [Hyphomicrobiaceae bacterium]